MGSVSAMREDVATCRGCGMVLVGKPYFKGGDAYHPRTKERCPVNHYGGFVCSPECDYKSSLRLEQEMPGHSASDRTLGCYAQASLDKNWSNNDT